MIHFETDTVAEAIFVLLEGVCFSLYQSQLD